MKVLIKYDQQLQPIPSVVTFLQPAYGNVIKIEYCSNKNEGKYERAVQQIVKAQSLKRRTR
jgi:hypothetical protein